MNDIFDLMKFRYEFRKHQKMMLEDFDKKFDSNKDKAFKFHVSAPPGSGKTIVGLEIARRLGKPALVICPNTTIQGQWAEKVLVNERKALKSKIKKSALYMTGTITATALIAAVAAGNPAVFALSVFPMLLGIGSVQSMRKMWQ